MIVREEKKCRKDDSEEPGAVVGCVLISIRPADEDDNAELVSLEKMCPTGTSLVLQFDRSPDFFARSHVYDNYRVYIAEA